MLTCEYGAMRTIILYDILLVMHLLWSYIKKYKKTLGLALLMTTINQGFSLVNPQIFRMIVDNYALKIAEFTQSEFIKGVGLLLLVYVGVALVSRTAKAFQDYYSNVVSERVGAAMYADSVEHVFSLEYSVFEDQQSGSLLEKLQKARDNSKKLILSLIGIGFFSLVGIVFALTYAFTVHPAIGGVLFLSIPVVGWVVYKAGKRIKQAERDIVSRSAELAATTTETLQNVGLVKSLGLEDQEVNRLDTVNNQLLGLELKKVLVLRRLSYIQGTLVNFVSSLSLFVIMYFIFQGAVSVGEFLTLWVYTFFIFQPLGAFAQGVTDYQQTKASLAELEGILNTEPTAYQSTSLISVDALENITFADVSFKYQSASHPSIKNINMSIGRGQVIGIAGSSGSGKSTLLKVLLGLYEPSSGNVAYNGYDGIDIDFKSVRQLVGYVPQDTQVFAGSVRDNLLFVKPNATDEECLTVLAQAQVMEILDRGDEGLDTVLGERGIKLSGGEKQRLAIARALLRKPSILIFDEATSSLDSITEQEITATIRTINKSNPDLIMIIVAHRLSTLEHTDTVYVVRGGSIVESGNHQELIGQGGLYSAMWKAQSA
jgi:ATP-binding cassette subfamily B protein